MSTLNVKDNRGHLNTDVARFQNNDVIVESVSSDSAVPQEASQPESEAGGQTTPRSPSTVVEPDAEMSRQTTTNQIQSSSTTSISSSSSSSSSNSPQRTTTVHESPKVRLPPTSRPRLSEATESGVR